VTAVLLGAIVSLAASAASWVSGSLLVAACWPSVRRPVEQLRAGVRAQVLAALRLLPSAIAALALPLVFISFVSLEPAQTSEVSGILLIAAALGGLAAMLVGVTKAVRGWRATMDALRQWTTSQRVMQGDVSIIAIDEPFPVVAVVGIWRPRLYIARTVLAVCDQCEVEAMIAHEAAHVAARDNLTRLLFLCAVPMRGLAGTATELETAWTKATEEAADDLACRDVRSALALASALTKVSRLAAGHRAPLLHASAILSGAAIEHRVRRLLLPTRAAAAPRVFAVLLGAAFVVATGMMSPPGRGALYHAAELCVQYLP
jgi:beta-lactamase regulating signal transducer with metallopeptidase domain